MNHLKNIFLATTLFACSATAWAIPNPAAVNCSQKHLQYVLIEGNIGVCIFDDNTYCEEWALFHNQCKKGQYHFPGGKFQANKQNQYCTAHSVGPTGAGMLSVVMCNSLR